MIRALAFVLLLLPGLARAEVDEAADKSLMFAGRCLAQMLTGEAPDVGQLKEMPAVAAQGHLFGEPGRVYYGEDDSVVFVVHKATHCGVNAFDESAEDAGAFLEHWLVRADSPFAKREEITTEQGNVRISYAGHCTECGFDVHAQAYWFRLENFTIYRVYATKPEDA